MPNKPEGRYRTLGERGQPSIAFVEVGSVMLEISEQEYRDQGFEPDFDELPCKTGYCFVDQENNKRDKR
jgi:hypothetical protein